MALVRESSALMVGQYFKRRRDFVEVVVQIGAGIGVILFAVFFKEALGYTWLSASISSSLLSVCSPKTANPDRIVYSPLVFLSNTFPQHSG